MVRKKLSVQIICGARGRYGSYRKLRVSNVELMCVLLICHINVRSTTFHIGEKFNVAGEAHHSDLVIPLNPFGHCYMKARALS